VEAEKNGILQAKLEYVLEPTEDEVAQMKAYLAKKYQKDKVALALEKKPELIGGFVLRVGDIEEDYSMKGRLNRLERRQFRLPGLCLPCHSSLFLFSG